MTTYAVIYLHIQVFIQIFLISYVDINNAQYHS